jgi:WD40 repeat protein
MDTLRTETTPEDHTLVITDVRFRPNSSQLATASCDKSVRLWDAANVSYIVTFCNLIIIYNLFIWCLKIATIFRNYIYKIQFTLFPFFSLQPTYCVQEFTGHTSAIMSLDFHPKKTDIFCFCDSENEIRYYHIASSSCTRVSKVGQTNAFCYIFFQHFYPSLIFITIDCFRFREVVLRWGFSLERDSFLQLLLIK